jgi:hypothetical protein
LQNDVDEASCKSYVEHLEFLAAKAEKRKRQLKGQTSGEILDR